MIDRTKKHLILTTLGLVPDNAIKYNLEFYDNIAYIQARWLDGRPCGYMGVRDIDRLIKNNKLLSTCYLNAYNKIKGCLKRSGII